MVRDNPWTAVPARRFSASQLNLRVNIIIAALVLAAVSGPAAILFGAFSSASSSEGASSATVVDPVAALALQVAAEFAVGSGTRVTAADGVDVSFGFGSSTGGSVSLGGAAPRGLVSGVADVSVVERVAGSYLGGRTYEIVYVRVVGSSGGSFVLAVPVFTSPPALAAGVSVVPEIDGARTRTPALDYRDHPFRSQPAGQLVRVVNEWAEAFAGGDASQLKRLTGDTQPGSYLPLGGFSVGRVEVVNVVSLTDSSVSPPREHQAVRVRLLLSPLSSPGSVLALEYDLRVDNPSSDFPLVTAWGPAGSSPLEPFSNRL